MTTWANMGAAAIRSGWGATEKNFASGERFAVGEPSLRAQTSPLPSLSAVGSNVAGVQERTVRSTAAAEAVIEVER